MPTEANVHGNKGVPQIPVQGTKTIFASVGIDPKQSVIALWMRKLCGAIYVVRSVWCELCGASHVVQSMWSSLCGVSYVV